MVAEVVEATLEERRREAARHNRVAAARRTRRSSGVTPAWRVHVGRVLIAAGSIVGGQAASGGLDVRRAGGAR
ncbi:MAG: hypothetical protein KY460_01850 [Actinobacteria bacterium]|nr:hypothetical protein [Actinomycetota bacterium]